MEKTLIKRITLSYYRFILFLSPFYLSLVANNTRVSVDILIWEYVYSARDLGLLLVHQFARAP